MMEPMEPFKIYPPKKERSTPSRFYVSRSEESTSSPSPTRRLLVCTILAACCVGLVAASIWLYRRADECKKKASDVYCDPTTTRREEGKCEPFYKCTATSTVVERGVCVFRRSSFDLFHIKDDRKILSIVLIVVAAIFTALLLKFFKKKKGEKEKKEEKEENVIEEVD